MLNKTNGFKALIRLLRPAYLRVAGFGEVPSKQAFFKLFSKSTLTDEQFDIERFAPGTSGETALFHHLAQELGLANK
jgi:hypothetical protein